MQLDQPGEIPAAMEPAAYVPRSRSGTRAAMRATNRYTMPSLVPRAQQNSDLFRDIQSQDWELAASSCQPAQQLPSGEDAWLNDVMPPSRPDKPPDAMRREARAGAGVEATARVAPTIQTPGALSAEYGKGDPRGRPGFSAVAPGTSAIVPSEPVPSRARVSRPGPRRSGRVQIRCPYRIDRPGSARADRYSRPGQRRAVYLPGR